MLSSSELGLKAGVISLLKGHRVGPWRVGGVPLSLGLFFRPREQMDVFPQCLAECASEVLVPRLSPSLLVTSLGLVRERWASCKQESISS